MKRDSHLVLGALVALSFGLSAVLLTGAVRAWGAPALRSLATVATRVRPMRAAVVCDGAVRREIVAVSNGFDVYSDSDDDQAFALVEPGAEGGVMVEASGRRPDLDALTRSDHRALLWFVHDGAEWVSRDPAVIARAREIVAPSRALGRQMGEVGRQLGARGARAGQLGGRMGALAGRLAALESRRAYSSADTGERAELRREANALRAEMDAMSARMRETNAGDTAPLRERMRDLARRQAAASRTSRAQMHVLIESTVRGQKAERLGVGA